MRNTGQRPRTIAPDRLSHLDLNQLRTFVAVSKAGSFSAATRALRVRQPAISKAIASLEHAVGVALFERGSRGVSLTSEGARLMDTAERLLTELGATLETVSQKEQRLSGDLVLCAQEHVASRLLPWPLAQLRPPLP